MTFSDPLAWREGAEASRVASVLLGTRSPYVTSDAGHNFATSHLTLPRMPGEPSGYGHAEADLKEIWEAAERTNRSKGRRR